MDFLKAQLDAVLISLNSFLEPVENCVSDVGCVLDVFDKLSADNNSSIVLLKGDDYELKREKICDPEGGPVSLSFDVLYSSNLKDKSLKAFWTAIGASITALGLEVVSVSSSLIMCKLAGGKIGEELGGAIGGLFFLLLQLFSVIAWWNSVKWASEGADDKLLEGYQEKIKKILNKVLSNTNVKLETESLKGNKFRVNLSRGKSSKSFLF